MISGLKSSPWHCVTILGLVQFFLKLYCSVHTKHIAILFTSYIYNNFMSETKVLN